MSNAPENLRTQYQQRFKYAMVSVFHHNGCIVTEVCLSHDRKTGRSLDIPLFRDLPHLTEFDVQSYPVRLKSA